MLSNYRNNHGKLTGFCGNRITKKCICTLRNTCNCQFYLEFSDTSGSHVSHRSATTATQTADSSMPDTVDFQHLTIQSSLDLIIRLMFSDQFVENTESFAQAKEKRLEDISRYRYKYSQSLTEQERYAYKVRERPDYCTSQARKYIWKDLRGVCRLWREIADRNMKFDWPRAFVHDTNIPEKSAYPSILQLALQGADIHSFMEQQALYDVILQDQAVAYIIWEKFGRHLIEDDHIIVAAEYSNVKVLEMMLKDEKFNMKGLLSIAISARSIKSVEVLLKDEKNRFRPTNLEFLQLCEKCMYEHIRSTISETDEITRQTALRENYYRP